MANDDPEQQAKRAAWVLAVLGVQLSGTVESGAAELKQRLASGGRVLQTLKAQGAPELPALLKQFAAATKGLDTAEAPLLVDALEAALGLALSAARGREARATNPSSIDGTKLRLRWRNAQNQVATALTAIGSAVLARDDVQQDPRFAQVQTAVKSLPLLVPEFGGALEVLLDQAVNAGSTQTVAKDALAAIATYRQSLSGAKTLIALELFAKARLGTQAPLYTVLDQALSELADELALAA